jgi:hypothetical protein
MSFVEWVDVMSPVILSLAVLNTERVGLLRGANERSGTEPGQTAPGLLPAAF